MKQDVMTMLGGQQINYMTLHVKIKSDIAGESMNKKLTYLSRIIEVQENQKIIDTHTIERHLTIKKIYDLIILQYIKLILNGR